MRHAYRFRTIVLSVAVAMFFIMYSAAVAADQPKNPVQSQGNRQTNPSPAGPAMLIQKGSHQKPVVVEVKNSFTVTSGEAKMVATVKSADGTPVRQGEVKFRINGALVDFNWFMGPAQNSVTTDDNGIAFNVFACNVGANKSLHMGANTIEAEFTGKSPTNEYMPGKGTATLSILRAQTKIVDQKVNYAHEHRRCLTLQDDQCIAGTCGSALGGRPVSIWADGKQVTKVMTDKDGSYFGCFAYIPSGHRVKDVFEGDALYLPSSLEWTQ